MKKLTLTSLLIIITLGFSSCSVEDDSLLLDSTSSKSLLKDYTFQRDATGAYSVNIELSKGAFSENIIDEKTNTNNFYLFSSQDQPSSRVKEDLAIRDGELRIGFNDMESNDTSMLTVRDKKAYLDKSGLNSEYLESYSFSNNGDGTYSLDFKVKNGVDVDFVYNEVKGKYEIHLEEDKSKDNGQREFLRTFTKENDEVLWVGFVNHYGIGKSATTTEDIPEIIITGGNDGGDSDDDD